MHMLHSEVRNLLERHGTHECVRHNCADPKESQPAVFEWRVNCYRGTGNYKLLIIFTLDGTENTDYKEIYSAGDSDGDEDNYSWDDYKLLTDSTFQTFESYTRHNSTKQGEKNKIKWQINDKGRIDSVLHKVK